MPKKTRRPEPGEVFATIAQGDTLYAGISDDLSWKVRVNILNAHLTQMLGSLDRQAMRGVLMIRTEAIFAEAMANNERNTALACIQTLAKLANIYNQP